MKGRRFIRIGAILTCIITVTFLFLYNRFDEPIKTAGYYGKELMEAEQFLQTLNEAGLFEEIGRSLYEKGYSFGLEYDILSEKSVEIVIKLPSKEANEETKKTIKQIANSIIEKNKFDPKFFTIKVSRF